jgi:hypothetical protein
MDDGHEAIVFQDAAAPESTRSAAIRLALSQHPTKVAPCR